jgi:hypothetical protein
MQQHHEALRRIRDRISAAETKAGRAAGSTVLIAVSKTFGPAEIVPVIADGQRVFGENRVQEAEAKWPQLKAAFPDVRLHLVGPLQRNKLRRALRLFDVIESLDREELARALAETGAAEGRQPDLLIQVNTGEEPQKAGVLPLAADAFIALCRERYRLPVKGLMCIPPVDEEPALHFALLREIARRNGLADLSMGMTADFEKAIAFGATLVRVGTAIFGTRGAGEAAAAEPPSIADQHPVT